MYALKELQKKMLKSFLIKKNKYSLFFVSIILISELFISSACSAVLANEGKRGLRAYTIEGVLRLKEEEIDLATAALILGRDWGTRQTSHVYRRKIDDMAEEILEKIKDKHIPMDYHVIPIINDYLFDELGFKTIDNADNPDDLFLHNVLETKRGYCLSLSVLYLSIAERLGLPMYGVVVPGHFFVRYDDGTHRYNIETTAGGGVAEDKHYIDKFNPPNRPNTLYMKNLTKKQTLGCFFNNLGNSYLAVRDIEKAFTVLKGAVEINPLLSEANMNLGNIYLQKQMPYEAISQYEHALSILGNDDKAFHNLGSAYMQLAEYNKAESYYRTALKINPKYVDVYRNLANALHCQGKNREAVSHLQAAIALNPNDALSCLLLGQIYQELKESGNAEKYLQKALGIDPSLVSARISLGFVYLDENRYDPALDAFQTALAYDPEHSQAYFGIAQVYYKNGQIENEIWAYEQALSINPDTVPALQNLGNAYLKQDNVHAAIQAYERAIQLAPANGAIYYNLGVALAKEQKYEQAIEAYFQTIELEPASAQAYNGIAISYYHLGDYESAKAYAQKAKKLGYAVQDVLLKLK